MAAISSVYLSLCSQGDTAVVARQLYGGTHALTQTLLPRFGIETTLVDVDDYDGIEKSLDGAKLLYCETIGNPRVVVADLERLADIAQRAGVPLVVDNTFASPILCRPIELGASVSIHSATKFLGGHHDLMGGVVCGSKEIVDEIADLARELGPTLSPFNAWLALRGIATLPLRVERSSASAAKVAEALNNHPKVSEVSYPGLEGDPSKALTDRMLGGRGGGTLGFDVVGGRDAAARVQDALELIIPAASLGGTHSLMVHAASVTHTQLSAAELTAAGISEGFCRLSVGLEDPGDLIADLDQALAAA